MLFPSDLCFFVGPDVFFLDLTVFCFCFGHQESLTFPMSHGPFAKTGAHNPKMFWLPMSIEWGPFFVLHCLFLGP